MAFSGPIEQIVPVTFQEDIHKYFDGNGRVFAGTTSAIGDYTRIEGLAAKLSKDSEVILDSVLNKAAEKGTLAHKAVEAYVNHKLGTGSREALEIAEAALGGNAQAYLSYKQFRAFDKEYKPAYIASEKVLASAKHGYAGTFDIFARIDGEETLLDFKTSQQVSKSVGKQTAAYVNLLRENTGYQGPIKRAIIHAPGKDKQYDFITESNTEYFKDTDLEDYLEDLKQYKARGMKERVMSQAEAEAKMISRMEEKSIYQMWAPGDLGKPVAEDIAVEDFVKGAMNKAGMSPATSTVATGRWTKGSIQKAFTGAGFGKSVANAGVLGAVIGIGYTGFHNITSKEEDQNSYIKGIAVGAGLGAVAGGLLKDTSLLTDVVESMDGMMKSGYNKAREGGRAARSAFAASGSAAKFNSTVAGALAAAAKVVR